MALIQVWAWKCEAVQAGVRCGHEWLAADVEEPPTWCAKCRSRKWHLEKSAEATLEREASEPEISKISKTKLPKVERRRGGRVPIGGVPEHPRPEVMPAENLVNCYETRLTHARGCPCLMCKPPKG